MKGAYYNEIDPFAAAWLRNLIAAGHLPAGDVDERSIVNVRADDLVGYTQVHFFAGVGGWPLALRLAGIPDDAPVWTGSCPCQPFSVAGKGRGADDERHLWPEMRRLVAECRPAIVVGEQVAGRAGLDWLSAVRSDLEGLGYAVGAADLCAAGVGAPHLRQRLYWGAVADSMHTGWASWWTEPGGGQTARGGGAVRLAYAHNARLEGRRSGRDGAAERAARPGGVGGQGSRGNHGLADAMRDGWQQGRRDGAGSVAPPDGWTPDIRLDGGPSRGPRATHGGWADADWLGCRDSRWRPVEPGTFPLADGVSGRVGQLRGYGNAIVPQVAAAFVTALLG